MNITGNVLKHAQHIEDGIIFSKENAELSYKSLCSAFETLKGNAPEGSKISTKVDGAPSVAVASDFNGKAFVCYKSALDGIIEPQIDKKTNLPKEPDFSKICYTEEDCDRIYGIDGKGPKMKALMHYAKSFGIPKNEIWQGDFMYSANEVFLERIDGEERVCFHPNTIIYTIPKKDPLAKKVLDSNYGIIWHTKYVGDDFGKLHISFNVDADKLTENKEFLSLDANIKNIAGSVTLTEEETEKCKSSLENIRSNLDKLFNDKTYEAVCQTKVFKDNMLKFMNYLIKSEEKKQFVQNYIEKFVNYMGKDFDEHANSVKTEKAKEQWNLKKQQFNNFIYDHIDTFNLIIDTQRVMVEIKELIEQKLNNIPQRWLNYVKYKNNDTVIPVGQEGFCISDVDGNLQKIVSRLSFSLNNFDPNIEKGWESDRRNRQYVRESIEELPSNELLGTKETVLIKENIKNIIKELNSKYNVNYVIRDISRHSDSRHAYEVNIENHDFQSRNDSADKFVELIKESDDIHIISTTFMHDRTAPIFNTYCNVNGNNVFVIFHFKDIVGHHAAGGLDGKTIAKMEICWGTALLDKINKGAFSPREEYAKIFELVSDNNSGWYTTITEGSNRLIEKYDLYNKQFVLNRLGFFNGIDDSDKQNNTETLHTLIANLPKERKDLNIVQKDLWNPADIYLIDALFYDEYIIQWKNLIEDETKTLNDFNEFLRMHLNDNTLLGISLKEIGTGRIPSIESCNITQSELDDVQPSEYQFFFPTFNIIKNGDSKLRNGVIMYFTLNNEPLRLEHRRNHSEKLEAPITEMYKRGSKARFGKVNAFYIHQVTEEAFKRITGNLSDGFEYPSAYTVEETMKTYKEAYEEAITYICNSGLELPEYFSLNEWMKFYLEYNGTPYHTLNDAYYYTQWGYLIPYLCLWAYANKNNKFDELFSIIYYGSQHIGKECAPFIKVHD